VLVSIFASAAEHRDVIVVTANPAGVAAAVASAQSGAKVIVLGESAHVGGIIAGGLTSTDIRKHGAVGGLYDEFNRRIVEG
jgi:ribulose 1,5-bisphosphate synthetase/thiazole synthase